MNLNNESFEDNIDTFSDSYMPFTEYQNQLLENLKPFAKLQSEISKMNYSQVFSESFFIELRKASEAMKYSTKNLQESFNKMSQQFNSQIYDSMQNMLKVYKELFNLPISHPYYEGINDLNRSQSRNKNCCENSESTSDYVTIEKSAAEEFELPDTIAIPFGKRRVKISTALFIDIIITIIFSFLTLLITTLQGCDSVQSQDEYHEEQIQLTAEQIHILQMQNRVLYDLIQTAETSSSTQAKVIEDLSKSVQAQNSQIFDLKESVDSCQQSIDTMFESGNTEPEN